MEFPIGPSPSHDGVQAVKKEASKIPLTPKGKVPRIERGDSRIPQPNTSSQHVGKLKENISVSKLNTTKGAKASYQALETLTGKTAPKPESAVRSSSASRKEKPVSPPGSPLSVEEGGQSEKTQPSKLKKKEADQAYSAALQAKKVAQGKVDGADATFKRRSADYDGRNAIDRAYSKRLTNNLQTFITEIKKYDASWNNEKKITEFAKKHPEIERDDVAFTGILEDLENLQKAEDSKNMAQGRLNAANAENKAAGEELERAKKVKELLRG